MTLFIILFFGFCEARAGVQEQPEINSTSTESSLVSPDVTPPDIMERPSPHFELPELKTNGVQHPVVIKTVEAGLFGPQVNPCVTGKLTVDTWLDQVHALVQDHTCESAVWFDSFFGRDHVLLDLRPGTFIILRNTARFTRGPAVLYTGDFNVTLELPHFEKLLRKTRLFIDSGSDADKYTTQPGQPIEPGINRDTGIRQPIIGVRLDLYTRLRTLFRIDSGIKINTHPDAFIRMRYQYLKDFKEVYLFRFSEIAMMQAVEHFSNTLQLDLERKLNTFSLVRWGNNITYTDNRPGITWNTGLSLFTQLTPKSAISYDTSMWGVNDPEWIIQNYRLGTRYRRNFYRSWLFFELVPEVTWPQDVNGNRKATYAFMVTLEMQFGK